MFIHLNVHSDFSMLESSLKISKIIELCKKNNMPAIALTDTNNMCGMMEFVSQAINNGIQPIISCALTLLLESKHTIKVSLLVKNKLGYNAILDYTEKYFCRPMPFAELKKTDGLICLTGDLFFATYDKGVDINFILNRLYNLFGDDLYCEIRRQNHNYQDMIEKKILDISYKLNIPIVATNNVVFENKSDYIAHKALYCISNGGYLISSESDYPYNEQCYFSSQEEMQNLFADLPDAIENTVYIAKKCCFILHERQPELPVFSDKSENDLIYKQSLQGLQKRFKDTTVPENYINRLNYELSIITSMNYSGYFLIVSDFILWSKNNGIAVGPGRGSGVGSIVAWSLFITELDPIEYNLLFERFLNPERISMPDFDIDFCQENRFKVINYIKEKYGNVAHIITFGKLQARAVLRDVGRVLQIPYPEVDKICRLVPNNPSKPVTLQQAIDEDDRLQQIMLEGNKTIQSLFSVSLKLEGLYRHSSIHAAGIVISDKNLKDFVPIYKDEKSSIPVTQYSMKYVEASGLVKFDFLGLKTLTIIDRISQMIAEKDSSFDIAKIPLDDNETYDFLSTGKSIGIFQLEGFFMRETLTEWKPDSLGDIIALVSLNRPGPMENIPTYIRRKHNKEEVNYYYPILKPVLKETFGVIIYQEQVMEIARIMSGYSLAEADILRRAMGKKRKEEMDLQRDKFILGATNNGIDETKAKEIFDIVAKFAGYGFNKSHAAAYGLISYQTAYLKTHYTVEFIVTCMNIDIDDTDKLSILCNDAKSLGIKILPPDINLSDAFFTIENNHIRYGIAAVKNIGINIANELKKTIYNNINDFCSAISSLQINKKNIESLIKTGTLDRFGYNRATLIKGMEHILNYSKNNFNSAIKQISLFENQACNKFDLPKVKEFVKDDIFAYQYQFFGFYIFGHPISRYDVKIKIEKTYIMCIITKIVFRNRGNDKVVLLSCSSPHDNYVFNIYGNDKIQKYYDLLQIGQKVVVKIKSINSLNVEYLQDLDYYVSNLYQNKLSIYVKNIVSCIKLLNIIDLSEKDDKNGMQIVIYFVDKDKKYTESILPHKYIVNILDLLDVHDLFFLSV